MTLEYEDALKFSIASLKQVLAGGDASFNSYTQGGRQITIYHSRGLGKTLFPAPMPPEVIAEIVNQWAINDPCRSREFLVWTRPGSLVIMPAS